MICKICTYPCCDELACDGDTRCAEHVKARKQSDKLRWLRVQTTPEIKAARKLYQSRWWQRESKRFLAINPLCVHCAEPELVTSAREVDHIKPHRGDTGLFRARANWQALCTPCHSRKTARETLHR